ncbi:hypothetical protein FOCC_FOCC017363, partial [Frankliniella occidentalis]
MARAVGVAVCNVVVLTLAVALAAKQPKHPAHADQHAVVQAWAEKLGKELGEFASSVTRIRHLHDTFKKATVSVRNATALLDGVVRNVQDLMQIRVEQVHDIRRAAEEIGRIPPREMPIEVRDRRFRTYLGVKDYETTQAPPPPAPPKETKKSIVQRYNEWRSGTTMQPPTTTAVPTLPPTTLKPWLVHDEYFPGGSLVNESLSAVHVPVDVNDGTLPMEKDEPEEDLDQYTNSTGADVLRVIKITRRLDDVFVSNKERDRTTSWQFFAHYSGVMRQYPASKWDTLYQNDYFDARLRPWYMGAARSPKDVIILMDNSASISMTEPSLLTNLIAHMILDTLGPDDFVSVLLFNQTVYPLVPGLDHSLIPATSAYVRELQFALEASKLPGSKLPPKGNVCLPKALNTSFQLLEKYRRQSLGAACNQAIMLGCNKEDRPKVYKRFEIDNSGRARVFTFVIKEPVQGEEWEAQKLACANMGWHTMIWKSGARATLQYLPVMSRPLVLAGMHPVHWTHMYADVTVPGISDQLWIELQHDEQVRRLQPFCIYHYALHPHKKSHYAHKPPIVDKELGKQEEFVITVSVPTQNGDILGVAGIDVPISQIKRLIPQHKVGVNGYIFMVTNNGLVVFHPGMRPMFNGILKPGYNSVDMTELEQEDVPFLRNMSKSMKEHRVSRWNRRYHFQGVPDTPYSMVMAVPEDYGAFRVESGGTADKLPGMLAAERNWAVHPDWSYCACCGVPGRQGLHNRTVFARGLQQGRGRCARCEGAVGGACADSSLGAALAQDVEWTKPWFAQVSRDATVDKRWQLGNVSIAFMATHSGLTRWVTMSKNTVVRDDIDQHVRRMEASRGPDEVWYRRAVESAAAAASVHQPAYQMDQVDHWVVSVPLVDEPEADVYS